MRSCVPPSLTFSSSIRLAIAKPAAKIRAANLSSPVSRIAATYSRSHSYLKEITISSRSAAHGRRRNSKRRRASCLSRQIDTPRTNHGGGSLLFASSARYRALLSRSSISVGVIPLFASSNRRSFSDICSPVFMKGPEMCSGSE